MIFICDEAYKPGLNCREKREITRLSLVKNSFVGFVVELELSENALVCFSDVHEELINKPLASYRVAAENSDIEFKLYQLGFVDGVADPVINVRYKELKKGDRLCIYAHAELDESNVLDKSVKIKLFKKVGDREELFEQKALELEIIDFALPLCRDYSNKLDLWQHNTCIARYYGLLEYSDEHFELLEKYVEALSKLGQRSITIIAANMPWDGQRRGHSELKNFNEVFETQMTRVYKQNSSLSFDFSIVDRYIGLCEKYGISEEIEVFGLCGAWTEKSLVRAWTDEGFVNLNDSEFESYVIALYEHFVKMGYAERTLVCADEPHDRNRFSREIEQIKRLAPGFGFKGAFDELKIIDEFGDGLKHVVLSMQTAARRIDELKRLNITKSWYVCCSPDKPNSFLTSELLEIRSFAYFNELFGFNGFLRWAVWAFTKEPYLSSSFGPWPLGDTYLIYPGRNGRPVLSLRFFMLRRMMEDMQLLAMLGEKSTQFVQKILKIKAHDEISFEENRLKGDIFSLEYSDYELARLQMIENIKALSND